MIVLPSQQSEEDSACMCGPVAANGPISTELWTISKFWWKQRCNEPSGVRRQTLSELFVSSQTFHSAVPLLWFCWASFRWWWFQVMMMRISSCERSAHFLKVRGGRHGQSFDLSGFGLWYQRLHAGFRARGSAVTVLLRWWIVLWAQVSSSSRKETVIDEVSLLAVRGQWRIRVWRNLLNKPAAGLLTSHQFITGCQSAARRTVWRVWESFWFCVWSWRSELLILHPSDPNISAWIWSRTEGLDSPQPRITD